MFRSLDRIYGSTKVYLVSKNKLTKKVNKSEITQKRSIKGISKSTRKALNLVTFDSKTFPVGSYKFRSHRYPSDIDIFEIVSKCCTVNTATNKMVSTFKKLARKIQNEDNVFLGDFKTGLDDRFIFDYGEIVFKNNRGFVKDYNPEIIRKKLREWRDDKLISIKEYNQIYNLVKPKLTVKQFYILDHKYLRNLRIVRWGLKEIIKGEKKLRGRKILTLKEALTHDTIAKLDIWAKVDNRYIEVTNFFLLVVKNKSGKGIIINKKLEDRLKNLDSDINKYSSVIFRNSLKLAKRYWNKASWLNDMKTMTKLYPLFQSDVSALNQIAEDAGLIVMMLEGKQRPPLKELFYQIDDFKQRLNNIFDTEFDSNYMYNLIDNIMKKKTIKYTIPKLNKLIFIIKEIVEHNSYRYMKELNIVKGKYAKTILTYDEDKTYEDLYGLDDLPNFQ